ncbi:MAG: hypothetical protein A2V88_12785 [Elusimicrobia bacterium RBG_16_66_12]|nr:MAG: hypothetical protein A2V88_12785 [Elusimicrobia bacterium RBG_16_66_12]
MSPEISVEDLKAKLDKKETFILLDVREAAEHAAARIAGSTLIPLAELPSRCGELDKSREVVVHCRSGARSERAVAFLIGKGYDAVNVAGGIRAWSERIDPSVPLD